LLLAAFSMSAMARAQGDPGELWVTSQGTDRLFIVHGEGSSIETVPLPGIGPHISTCSPLGDYAFVSQQTVRFLQLSPPAPFNPATCGPAPPEPPNGQGGCAIHGITVRP
jgi:hypothetical protein